jgi:hypothetical protein
MCEDTIAPIENLNQLKLELYRYTNDLNFKKSESMGDLMRATFDFISRNFKNINLFG